MVEKEGGKESTYPMTPTTKLMSILSGKADFKNECEKKNEVRAVGVFAVAC